MRFRFNYSRATRFLDCLKHNMPVDGVQTKDDCLALAAACLIYSEGSDSRIDLGPNPSAEQIAAFEVQSASSMYGMHGAVQLARHLLLTNEYPSKFEDDVEIEIHSQDQFPFFSPSSKVMRGAKVENKLDLETSLFFEATT